MELPQGVSPHANSSPAALDSGAPVATPETASSEAPSAPARPTPTWALVVTTVLIVLVGQLVGFVLLLLLAKSLPGVHPVMTSGPHRRLTPEALPWLLALSTVVSLLLIRLASRRAPEGWRARIGWVRPRLAWRELGYATVATFALDFMAIVALNGMQLLGWLPTDEQDLPALARAVLHGSLGALWAILALGALAAPVMEESLFRGYLQRGVIANGRPVLALWLAAVLFSLSHGHPFSILSALPFALWQSWLAWKSGSVIPSTINHALVNALWLSLAVVGRLKEWPMAEESAKGELFSFTYAQWAPVLGVVSLVAFVLCARRVVGVVRAMDAREVAAS